MLTAVFQIKAVFLFIVTLQTTSPIAAINDEHNSRRQCDIKHCDVIVTLCQTTHRCPCPREDIQCTKDCVNCLDEFFGKCCGCVGLCPSPEVDQFSSHVGDIKQNITDEDLFNVLTETDDIHGRWSVEDQNFGENSIAFNEGSSARSGNDDLASSGYNLEKKKCLLAYINKRLQVDQCRKYCTSMGASRFRWFHDGCCECVGKHCRYYGSSEPKCLGLD